MSKERGVRVLDERQTGVRFVGELWRLFLGV